MNYQIELEKKMQDLTKSGKKLLLHSCCAPCSSYVLVYLKRFYKLTVFYYNPNITDDLEYHKRKSEQIRLIDTLNDEITTGKSSGYPIEYMEAFYDPETFLKQSGGLEKCPEGGERCFRCFKLRLLETAKAAKKNRFDYFATTLTLSPLKNADKINEIGFQMEKQYDIAYLASDFKKKEGYKQSLELSKKYDLYRQDYCGCGFSKNEREEWKKRKAEERNEEIFGIVNR